MDGQLSVAAKQVRGFLGKVIRSCKHRGGALAMQRSR